MLTPIQHRTYLRYRFLTLLATAAALVGLLRVFIPADSLDARLYYSSREVYPILAQYGYAGRRLYVWVEYLDLVFIGFYTMFLSKLTLTLTATVSAKFRSLSLASVAALAGFDLLETVGILVLLWNYPYPLTSLASIVSICTPLKWGALGVVLVATFVPVRGMRSGSR